MAAKRKPDLTEFFKLARPARPPCQVGFAREQLEEAEKAQLDAACATDTGIINTGAVQAWLKARGHSVSNPAITNHRRGTCRCADE